MAPTPPTSPTSPTSPSSSTSQEPSDYITPEHVRVAVSLAYSSFHNPRGLEKMWNSPWNETLSGLVDQYNGLFTVHAEYPMFLPSLVVEDLQLRQKFAELDLNYHNKTAREETAVDIHASTNDIDEELPIINAEDVTNSNDAPGNLPIINKVRRSGRISEVQRKAADEKIRARESMIQDLWRQRERLVLLQEATTSEKTPTPYTVGTEAEDVYSDDESFFDEGVSYQSEASVAEPGALNWMPDNVVNHVAFIKLPEVLENGRLQDTKHYLHRAGRKVYHYCTAIINELKSAPPRSFENSGELHHFNVFEKLRLAQKDLLEYCVAYFECHRDADSVIAIAGAGPFWNWCCIRRKDVPEWDWVSNCLKDNSAASAKKVYDKWYSLFYKDGSYATLGTKASDEELNQINKDYLYPMLTDGHTPAAPNFTWH